MAESDDRTTEETDSPTVGRRGLLKAAGLGAATLGLLGAPIGSATAAAPRSVRRLTTPNLVNLYCSATAGNYDGSGNATVNVTVGNFSSTAATGSVSLKVITPFFANVASLPSVSGATSSWLYQNSAADVPSIIKVTFSGFPANSSVTVPVSFDLLSGAPNVPPIGRAIFTTDAGNTADEDTDLTRNVWEFGFVRASLGAPSAGNSNLFFTAPQVPQIAGGSASSTAFNFYNGAGTLLNGTDCVSHFTFSTPFYTRVPSSGRPSGFSALYENSDPAIPSVYQLSVPAGVGLLGAGTPTTIGIPFAVQSGAPRMHLVSSAIVVPTGTDTQGDYSTSHHKFGSLSIVDTAV
ncbi:hypothetical protein [Kitasatospora purpeofusca]|uniref:hypothetical protein n=1 Tax=Kitasatospora purpeofusca TaxID=67352 RepID=UPI0036617089